MGRGLRTAIEYIEVSLRTKEIVQDQIADDDVVCVNDINRASKQIKRLKPRGKKTVRLGERIRRGTKRYKSRSVCIGDQEHKGRKNELNERKRNFPTRGI